MTWSVNSITWYTSTTTWNTDPLHPVSFVTPAFSSQISTYLQTLFTNSPNVAAPFLNDLVNPAKWPHLNGTIRIAQASSAEPGFASGNPSGPSPIDYHVGFNLNAIANFVYFNKSGSLVHELPELTVIHELYHLLGKPDPIASGPNGFPTDAEQNAPGYDFEEDIIRFQNSVATDAGWTSNIQAGYFSGFLTSDPIASYFTVGVNYTGGQDIDVARLAFQPGNNKMDMRAHGASRDLIFGLDGEDEIWGGDGDDYVYGGDNDDTIYTGAGNDEYWGGMRAQTGRTDGIDTVNYGGATNGIEITIGGTTVASTTVQDGQNGTDALHSIEQIIGTSQADTLTFTALNSTIAGAFDWIDLGGGTDTINVAGLNGAVVVDLRIAANQLVTFGGATFHVQNAENAVGGGGNDTIYYPSGTVVIASAGDGDDIFYLAGSGHTISGGGGFDTLNFSLVDSGRVVVGARVASVQGSGSSTFDSIEEIVGGNGSNLMYGDGSGTTLTGGAGLNYIEGSGSDILQSGTGDTYFAVSNGGTVISGAGNDYIEGSGSQPVTIKFGRGSGHDMLGSIFNIHEELWARDRNHDLILLEGLTPADIELVWNYTQSESETGISRVGEAAIRIKDTGETLYIGTILWEYKFSRDESLIRLIGIETYSYLSHDSEDDDADDDVYQSFELDIFSFDGVTMLDIFELFDLRATQSQALPADTKAAEDVLARLGQGGGTNLMGGTSGADNLQGSGGNDDMLGDDGNDTLDGGAGDDVIRGGGGNDTITGGSGNDDIDGQGGRDVVTYAEAGAGVTVSLASPSAQNTVGSGTDTLRNIESLIGSAFNHKLTGNSTDNVIDSGNGDDTIEGGLGDDILNGSGGTDTLSYATSGAGVTVSLSELDEQDTLGAGYDTISGFENLSGSAFSDSLAGDSGGNRLTGGLGNDTLSGGAGADNFCDTAVGLNGDIITDFGEGDRIVISDASLAGFSFSLSGNTLTYSGGSLTLTGFTGQLQASTAADGGVQLTVGSAPLVDARNDYNGDGRSDILWRNGSGLVFNWLGQPNGDFVDNTGNTSLNVGIDWQAAGVGDFNGDGRDDVLWRNDDGRVITWLGRADGGFGGNPNGNQTVSTSWQVAGVGDFNGDSRDDILWRNDDGRVISWLGKADGSFGGNPNGNQTVSNSWQVAGVGDFNGDGRDDVLWRNADGRVIDWLGRADGGFGANPNGNYTVSTNWQIVGVGDFNGDGRDDILWRNADGVVIDWLGRVDGRFDSNADDTSIDVDDALNVGSIGDFNGDGRDDVIWRNDNGAVTEWLGQDNGGFIANAGGNYNVSTRWHIQSPDLWM